MIRLKDGKVIADELTPDQGRASEAVPVAAS
jgi:hypothetical protein